MTKINNKDIILLNGVTIFSCENIRFFYNNKNNNNHIDE